MTKPFFRRCGGEGQVDVKIFKEVTFIWKYVEHKGRAGEFAWNLQIFEEIQQLTYFGENNSQWQWNRILYFDENISQWQSKSILYFDEKILSDNGRGFFMKIFLSDNGGGFCILMKIFLSDNGGGFVDGSDGERDAWSYSCTTSKSF